MELRPSFEAMKKRVLIVDDDRSVRESLRKVLAGAGYSVMLATDGQKAVDLFEHDVVDLLLLDIGLPGENGWETLEHITTRKPTPPIIVITGQTGQFNMALAAGVGALMQKPLDVTQLLQTMQQLLAEPEIARLHRLGGHSRNVRCIPCDSEMLSQKIKEQQTTPLHGVLANDEVEKHGQ